MEVILNLVLVSVTFPEIPIKNKMMKSTSCICFTQGLHLLFSLTPGMSEIPKFVGECWLVSVLRGARNVAAIHTSLTCRPFVVVDQEVNSPKCFDGNGTYECGICSCNPGRYGSNCECDSSEVSSAESDKKCL